MGIVLNEFKKLKNKYRKLQQENRNLNKEIIRLENQRNLSKSVCACCFPASCQRIKE